MRRLFLALLALGTAGILAACATDPIEAGDDDDDSTTFDDTFSGGAHPAILQEGCGDPGCHLAGTPQGGLALSGTTSQMYASIMAGGISGPAVNTSNAAQSLLLMKGAAEVPHNGSLQVWAPTDLTYQAVLNWITAGAQNN